MPHSAVAVKICGLTDINQADAVAALGAQAIGVIGVEGHLASLLRPNGESCSCTSSTTIPMWRGCGLWRISMSKPLMPLSAAMGSPPWFSSMAMNHPNVARSCAADTPAPNGGKPCGCAKLRI